MGVGGWAVGLGRRGGRRAGGGEGWEEDKTHAKVHS